MKRLAAVAAAILALLQIAPVHAQPARNFIWKVSGQTGAVYLVGSVHVGAAHLVGPDGLLAMFEAKGYKVEQL